MNSWPPAAQSSPDRRSPRLSTDHADLDLAVAGEAVVEIVLGTCHPDLHLIHGLRMLWVF
jgi:hypothetical protein